MLRWGDNAQEMFFIPETKEEWQGLKDFLIERKLEDKPETWTFILSQLQGVQMPVLTMRLTLLIAAYKRWKIAAVLQAEKLVYLQELEAKLRDKLEEVAKQNEGAPQQEEWTHPIGGMREGPSDISGAVPILSTSEEAVVQQA